MKRETNTDLRHRIHQLEQQLVKGVTDLRSENLKLVSENHRLSQELAQAPAWESTLKAEREDRRAERDALKSSHRDEIAKMRTVISALLDMLAPSSKPSPWADAASRAQLYVAGLGSHIERDLIAVEVKRGDGKVQRSGVWVAEE